MLEEVRKLFGYTQEELADKIGITQNYYTQIETGASKSTPVIEKISKALKIKESFLTSQGEYVEYPFLSDFYIFFLTDKRIFQSYTFVIDYICSRSKFIDAIFFLRRAETRFSPFPPVIYLALRDDHDTVFLFKRRSKTRMPATASGGGPWQRKEIESKVFPFVDSFREKLHGLRSAYIYEGTILIPDELFKKVEDNEVSRDDIISYFPGSGYFEGSARAHSEVKKR